MFSVPHCLEFKSCTIFQNDCIFIKLKLCIKIIGIIVIQNEKIYFNDIHYFSNINIKAHFITKDTFLYLKPLLEASAFCSLAKNKIYDNYSLIAEIYTHTR